MSSQARVQLHENFSARVETIGDEKEPILIIDNFLAYAETLVDFVAHHSQFSVADTFYPGIRSPAPDRYLSAFRYLLGDLIFRTFDLQEHNVTGAKADFSMVLTPPEQLNPLQRIPHYDSNKRSELAAVHYLCAGDHGGTAFYRHRTTGYEYVDHQRATEYKRAVDEDVKQHGMPAASYMNGSTELFEQIASFDAMFNRILIYRCTSLHSGNIAADFSFDPNPRTGRLSLNTFIFCRD
jgi:hypothetical protein